MENINLKAGHKILWNDNEHGIKDHLSLEIILSELGINFDDLYALVRLCDLQFTQMKLEGLYLESSDVKKIWAKLLELRGSTKLLELRDIR